MSTERSANMTAFYDAEANARLIASAPDLLAALQYCAAELDRAYYGTATLEPDHHGRRAVEQARAAIAKATAP